MMCTWQATLLVTDWEAQGPQIQHPSTKAAWLARPLFHCGFELVSGIRLNVVALQGLVGFRDKTVQILRQVLSMSRVKERMRQASNSALILCDHAADIIWGLPLWIRTQQALDRRDRDMPNCLGILRPR